MYMAGLLFYRGHIRQARWRHLSFLLKYKKNRHDYSLQIFLKKMNRDRQHWFVFLLVMEIERFENPTDAEQKL